MCSGAQGARVLFTRSYERSRDGVGTCALPHANNSTVLTDMRVKPSFDEIPQRMTVRAPDFPINPPYVCQELHEGLREMPGNLEIVTRVFLRVTRGRLDLGEQQGTLSFANAICLQNVYVARSGSIGVAEFPQICVVHINTSLDLIAATPKRSERRLSLPSCILHCFSNRFSLFYNWSRRRPARSTGSRAQLPFTVSFNFVERSFSRSIVSNMLRGTSPGPTCCKGATKDMCWLERYTLYGEVCRRPAVFGFFFAFCDVDSTPRRLFRRTSRLTMCWKK